MVLTTVGYGERAPDTMVGQVADLVLVAGGEGGGGSGGGGGGGGGCGARWKCSNLPKLCNVLERKLPSKPQYWFS